MADVEPVMPSKFSVHGVVKSEIASQRVVKLVFLQPLITSPSQMH